MPHVARLGGDHHEDDMFCYVQIEFSDLFSDLIRCLCCHVPCLHLPTSDLIFHCFWLLMALSYPCGTRRPDLDTAPYLDTAGRVCVCAPAIHFHVDSTYVLLHETGLV